MQTIISLRKANRLCLLCCFRMLYQVLKDAQKSFLEPSSLDDESEPQEDVTSLCDSSCPTTLCPLLCHEIVQSQMPGRVGAGFFLSSRGLLGPHLLFWGSRTFLPSVSSDPSSLGPLCFEETGMYSRGNAIVTLSSQAAVCSYHSPCHMLRHL